MTPTSEPATATVVANQAPAQVLLHSVQTAHQQIQVFQQGSARFMVFGKHAEPLTQTWIDTNDLWRPDEYVQGMVTAAAFHAAPTRVLCLGVGGGAIPRVLRKVFPSATVDAVDIDEEVLWTARTWFGLDADDGIRLYAEEARDFVRCASAKGLRWDVVIVDVFDHQYIPAHLMTVEFLRELGNVVADDGLIVSNHFAVGRLRDLESRTCAEAFGSFLEFPSENTSRVVVAHHGAMPQIDVIHANLRSHADSLNRAGVAPERAVSRLRVAGGWPEDTVPLTDATGQCPDLAQLLKQASADAFATLSP